MQHQSQTPPGHSQCTTPMARYSESRNTDIAGVALSMGCPVVPQVMEHHGKMDGKAIITWRIAEASDTMPGLKMSEFIAGWPGHADFRTFGPASKNPADRWFAAGMFAAAMRKIFLARMHGKIQEAAIRTLSRGELWSLVDASSPDAHAPEHAGLTEIEMQGIASPGSGLEITQQVQNRTLAIACIVHGFPWSFRSGDEHLWLAERSATLPGLTLEMCMQAARAQMDHHQRAAMNPMVPAPDLNAQLWAPPHWPADWHSFPHTVQTLANIHALHQRLRTPVGTAQQPWIHLSKTGDPTRRSAIIQPGATRKEQDEAARFAGL